MTLVSMCGVVLDNGRDCPNYVIPDSPINLCPDHFEVAYEWIARDRGHEPNRMPALCAICGHHIGRQISEGWVCEHCGYRQGDSRPEHVRQAIERIDWRPAVVYYIRFGDRIKIGTTYSLRRRLSSLPVDELLAIEHGSYDQEAKRHEQFAETRIGSTEWFHASPELEAHIRRLSAGVEDPWVQYEFWVKRAKPAA